MNRRPATNGAPSDINMIAEGTTVEGTVRTKGDVRISGKLLGELHADGRAIVTPEGDIKGNIYATSAEIGGRVDGDLHIAERLVLKESAVYSGNMRTQKLIIEDGATFSGRCEMGDKKPSAPTRPVPNVVPDVKKGPEPVA